MCILRSLNTVINGESLLDLLRGQPSDLILVDTRSFAEYAKGHIPGAINIDLMHFHWFDTSTMGILQFEKQMGLLLNYLGINHQIELFFMIIFQVLLLHGVFGY